MEPERKSDIVRRLVASGEYKKALSIAKGFRLGITPEDRDAMERGYECLMRPEFYRMIGMDPELLAKKGIDTVIRLYGVSP